MGTKLGAVTLPSFSKTQKGVLVCLNILKPTGLTDSPLPALTRGLLWLPLAWGPVTSLWLCLSLTRMPCYLSSSARSPSLPLLSWLLPCPLPLPGYPPFSPHPSPSWQSLDPAKQKQKSVSITAFCVPLRTPWDELGGSSNTHSHIYPISPTLPGSPWPSLPTLTLIPTSGLWDQGDKRMHGGAWRLGERG